MDTPHDDIQNLAAKLGWLQFNMCKMVLDNVIRYMVPNREKLLKMLPENEMNMDKIPKAIRSNGIQFISYMELEMVNSDPSIDQIIDEKEITLMKDIIAFLNEKKTTSSNNNSSTIIYSLPNHPNMTYVIYPETYYALGLNVVAHDPDAQNNPDVLCKFTSDSTGITIPFADLILTLYQAWHPHIRKSVPSVFGMKNGLISFLNDHSDEFSAMLRMAIMQTYAMIVSPTNPVIQFAHASGISDVKFESTVENGEITLYMTCDTSDYMLESEMLGLDDDINDLDDEDIDCLETESLSNELVDTESKSAKADEK